MTVWVVHPVAQDISAAAQYGEIKYITDRYVYPDELEQHNSEDWLPEKIRRKLLDVGGEAFLMDDYLLIAGDHLLLAQIMAYMGVLGPFRVLRYDREAKGYYPVRIDGATING